MSTIGKDIENQTRVCVSAGAVLLDDLSQLTSISTEHVREQKEIIAENALNRGERAKRFLREETGAVAASIQTLAEIQGPLASEGWSSPVWAEPTSARGEDIPQMLRVGQLVQVGAPAMLPNPAFGNVSIWDSIEPGAAVVEGLLVRSLASTPGIKIQILDPNNNGSTLARFGKADTNRGGVFLPTAVKPGDVSAALGDLSDRVHSIAQNFLQGSVDNLHAYNEQASVPESIHVVVAISPETFTNEQIAALEKLVRTGPKCGVYVIRLVTHEVSGKNGFSRAAVDAYSNFQSSIRGDYWQLPAGSSVRGSALESELRYNNAKFPHINWERDEVVPTELIHRVIAESEAEFARGQKSLSLRDMLRSDWAYPDAILRAAVGTSGTNSFELKLGISGAHPHLLVAGRTGAGKSTFLHTMICSLASRYSPRDLHFYLVDAKQGVEMSNYAPGAKSLKDAVYLPHVKIAAVKSDIRTYISVLERIRSEIRDRGRICAKHGVSNIDELARTAPSARLPRIVVVLDEFHVLITDPQFGTVASGLLKDVAKQARAYGIHLVLATQSLGNMGARGENAALFEQLGNRVALSCEANVSEMILGVGNTAASKLTRLGEAIFTEVVGSPEHNVPFQAAYIDPSGERPELITSLYARSQEEFGDLPAPFVFAGDSLADLSQSPVLSARPAGGRLDTEVWLGTPVRIAGPLSTRIDSFKNGNLLILGVGNDDASDISGTLSASALSAFKAHPSAEILIVNAHRDDPRSAHMEELAGFLKKMGANVSLLEPGRRSESALDELSARIKNLLKEGVDENQLEQTFVIVADGDGSLSGGKLGVIAADGASVGVHLIASFGTKRSLSSALGVTIAEKAMNMFDSRVFAVLNSSEAGASSLGLPEKPANEEERFTLWEASRPNRVEVFIPYQVPEKNEWDELEVGLSIEAALNSEEAL